MRKFLRRKKHQLIRFAYRCLRGDMVLRMRANGFSWNKINSTLRVLRQKQIVKVRHTKTGTHITYAYIAPILKTVPGGKGGWKQVETEPAPEIIDEKSNSTQQKA